MKKEMTAADLVSLLTHYKADRNPLTTLALMTGMPKASLYLIEEDRSGTPDQASTKDSQYWRTYQTKDGKQYLQSFTTLEKANAQVKEGQAASVQSLNFNQIALMVMNDANAIEGYVIDPQDINAKFNRNIIEKIWRYAMNHV
ncbi:SseB family protein [Aerococcus agrisoli]|uniref:SseB family protein n=1 Tax=Aerococcus agrisoli TaxID=2487350 RepID=A0A3N4G549_9LACT|nr:SseB family protein [Aerococcus agrisoli]RPA58003.1 SseB family protein [Aerococcus agrisoli]